MNTKNAQNKQNGQKRGAEGEKTKTPGKFDSKF